GELIDWNAESDCGNAHRGNHDSQQGQQYRHVFTPPSAILGSGHDAMVTLSVPSGQPLPGSGSVLVFRAFPAYVMLCNSASNGHWEALCGFPVASRETHP